MEAKSHAPFAEREDYLERLRQAPGESPEAQSNKQKSNSQDSKGWRWTLKKVRDTFEKLHDYTLSGVSRFLKTKLGVKMRSPRIQQYSPDPEYSTKVLRIQRCLHQTRKRPQEVRCVFIDEMSFNRWPQPASNWAAEPPLADRMGSEDAHWRLIASMDAWTGRVIYLDNYIVGRRQVIKFYELLASAYRHAKRLYVLQDNWNIHTHPDVLTALRSWPKIIPVWLPTYSPWLNPIEKLWKWLRQDVLYLHRLAYDWSALKATVRGFLDQFRRSSHNLLKYVGLCGDGQLARCLRPKINYRI